jgi:threonine/homoserine/homoserine lactone efflux protein
MEENKNSGFLKIVLLIFAILCIVYGIGYFIFPDFLVKLSGGEPVFHGWLRWSGGVLIGLGIGAIMAFQKPKNQGIFVTTIAIGTLLAGLALLYGWIKSEEGANVWFTALPTILVLVVSGLLWWTRQQAKDVLKSAEE